MTATGDAIRPPRVRCHRCLRPVPMCYCDLLPCIPTSTRVVILQHPHERTHPFGTARLVRLSLPNSEVHVPYAGVRGTLEHPLPVPDDTVVLFPLPDAPLVTDLPPAARPSTLLAIDGTWAHARRLYRENPWLRRLRHVRLRPPAPSRYRIRKEPHPDFMSTLEAIVEALRTIEPAPIDFAPLLAAFDGMIDRQIAHAAKVTRFGRRKQTRQRPSRALSPALADPRLVIAYAESAPAGGDPAAPRELIQWVAARIDGSDVFEALLRPRLAMPSAAHLAHMRLTAGDLAAGEDPAAAAARFAAWLGEQAPVGAWTATSLAAGASMLPPGTSVASLKISYCNLRHRRPGFLEQVLAAEGLARAAVVCRGRAAERLGNALAVARWLRTHRTDPLRVGVGTQAQAAPDANTQ
jgi:DTW domain-containing protein YfiP